jgi:hypothetical protein
VWVNWYAIQLRKHIDACKAVATAPQRESMEA